MGMSELQQRIDFIKAIDGLKEVQRQTLLMSKSRYEYSGEHSWAVATFALTLASYAKPGTDINKVIHMLLLHDIVEVDAGDTFCYDDAGHEDKAEREQAAADRLFGLLPAPQAQEFRALWDEFEAEDSQESQFAAALDRMIPILHNLNTDYEAWIKNGVTYAQILQRNQKIAKANPELWDYIHTRVRAAVESGHIPES